MHRQLLAKERQSKKQETSVNMQSILLNVHKAEHDQSVGLFLCSKTAPGATDMRMLLVPIDELYITDAHAKKGI